MKLRIGLYFLVFVYWLQAANVIAAQHILTDQYELSIPDGIPYRSLDKPSDQVVKGLKEDITHIVYNSTQLKFFPMIPEVVLPYVQL